MGNTRSVTGGRAAHCASRRLLAAARMPLLHAKACATSLFLVSFPLAAAAQTQPDLRQVIDRLDRLEAQNQELMTEIRALRQQLVAASTSDAAPPAPAEERAEVQERRVAELDQSKIGTEHRLP